MNLNFFSLLFGWVLDKCWGDPPYLPHPVVAFGRWIAFFEKKANHGTHRKAKGAFWTIVSITGTWGISSLLLYGIQRICGCPYLYGAVNCLLIFFCLAGTTLTREVRMVFEAADRSLPEGRRQVSRIVGRNTEELTDQEVRTAALETLAENLSDGVVAPLFWLALLGVPGMLTYKMINTLDSMIGYTHVRYKDFGCWAARIDDAANYLPARLTAFFMALASLLPHRGTPTSRRIGQELKFILRYGSQHASPNSGYPEAALAGILDCRFGGPHSYFGTYVYKPYIGEQERQLCTDDMHCATAINLYVEIITVGCCLLAYCL